MNLISIFINTIDPSKTKLLDYAVTLKGYEVCHAKEEADIIILDYYIHKNKPEHLGTTPVIVLGSNSDEEDILEGMYLHYTDYVLEPFEISELEMVIEKNLSRRFLRRPYILPPTHYI